MIMPTPPRRNPGVPSTAPLPTFGKNVLSGATPRTGVMPRTARAEYLAAFCLWVALCAPTLHSLPAANAAPPASQNQAKSPQPTVPPLLAPDTQSAPKAAVPKRAVPGVTPGATLTRAALPMRGLRVRNLHGPLQPRVSTTDAGNGLHPARVMFPLAALAKPTTRPGAASPVDLSLKTAAVTRLSYVDLALDATEVIPRSDTSLGALPSVWKAGRASRPITLLADAKEEMRNAAPHSAAPLPALSAPGTAEKNAVPGMGPASLVINVRALKLPPASRPLPPTLQSKAVPAETKYISSMPRLAQAGRVNGDMRAPGVSNQIDVTVSTFVVLVAPDDLQTVAIADPNIADVVVINSRAVLVNGKAPGATSLVIVDKKIRQYHVRVVPSPGETAMDVSSAVAAAIGLPNVQVNSVRGAVVLEGTVANADEKRRANEIAGLYTQKVVDLLQIRTTDPTGPVEPLPVQIKNAVRNDAVQVRVLGDTVLLEGQVASATERESAEAVATALAKDFKVVNLLQLPAPPVPAAPARLTIDDVNETLRPLQTPPPVVDPTQGLFPPTPATVTRITARTVRDQIILEGVAASPAAIEQALAIAARTGMAVVNRIELAPPSPTLPAELQQLNTIAMTINRAIPGATVIVGGSEDRLVLAGSVPSTNAAVLAEQIARGYSRVVDNLLTTPRPQQIDVDINILEINKNDLKNLGFTFTSLLDAGTGFIVGQATGAATGSDAFQTVSPFRAALRAEINNGNARLLSNPRTTVLSGRTATFKVGGEVPIPVGSTTNAAGTTTTIAFKPFGILLDVTPISSDDGVITMQVRTEVSQPDFVNLGITLPGGGSPIPGFSQRQAQTEVTVEPGGTLALGGLIQNNSQTAIRKIPILSKIPILGALFTSTRYQKNETELVVFVTPRLLESKLKPGMNAPASPASKGATESVRVPMGIGGIPSFTGDNSFATSTTSTGGATGGTGGG